MNVQATPQAPFEPAHEHVFLGDHHRRNERKVWIVIGLTASMMIVEIVAGTIFGSMALVADGWHMSTHAGAMLIAALAYLYARRHARDRRFTFGTGKLGELAGFASAVALALIALLIGWESLMRFYAPVAIDYPQATSVAVLGLAVNLLSAWLLRDDHAHHGHHHDHHHAAAGNDHNLRAAYLHVLADALTSVLAIAALVVGSIFGWLWPDPAMGIVGGLVIARWSWGLIRDTGAVLLDYVPEDEELPEQIRSALADSGAVITDLHVWQLGPGRHGAIIALRSSAPHGTEYYRAKLAHLDELSHITIEIAHA